MDEPVPEIATDYDRICASMVEAMDPHLHLEDAELVEMAATIARRVSLDVDNARATVLKMNRLSATMYARAGKPYGPSDEARWRWFFEPVDD